MLTLSCVVSANPQDAGGHSSLDARGASERVVYAFQGGAGDGAFPESGLIADAEGALYGATLGGGLAACHIGCGVVYKLTPSKESYTESVLYEFKGGTDGVEPGGDLLVDKWGALYGTTGGGGNSACVHGCGTIFRLAPSGSQYVETVLYRFQGNADGFGPTGLVADDGGALYGTTAFNTVYYHGGTVFKLTPGGSGYTKTTLYSFRGGPSDGDTPEARPLLDQSGALYGTTLFGGPQGQGTIFKLTPTRSGYKESIIHFFQGYDGQWPVAGLISDVDGSLYGTTTTGGTAKCRRDVYCGVVFKLTPTPSGYSITVLHNFRGGARDGANSKARLTAGPRGVLYGTTAAGGRWGGGVLFELKPERAGYDERIVYDFGPSAGGNQPDADVLRRADGSLYGTTSIGGNCSISGGCGTVFKATP